MTPIRIHDTKVRIVRDVITVAELNELAEERFGDLVKAVIDLEREVMAVGEGMHADEEAALLDDGSRQADLWGINFYPAEYGSPDWLEFDSMINLRPGRGNRTRSVDDPATRARITDLVARLVVP
jgi:Protein of unknown function (DUF5674)